MKQYNPRARFVIIILFASFILLAMPGAITSVGWPDIRDGFGLRQDSIGLYLIMGTVGHLLSGAFNGRLMYQFGTRNLFLIAIVTLGLSLYGFWLAPSWAVMVGLGLVGGWANGTIDATANTVVAARFDEKIMNWLHGFFGLGATLGPMAISLVVLLGSDWRGGAFLFGTLLFILFAVMLIFRPLAGTRLRETAVDPASVEHTVHEGEESAVSSRETLSLSIVWIAILFFFVYGGIEVSIGQWAFTIFTESRGLGEASARFWVSVYWGTFTIGRFVFGFVSTWLPTKTWLRICLVSTFLATLLLLLPNWLGLLGLALVGISQAPIFATLISLMPKLAGRQHASNAIGYVVGAAGIGVAFIPSFAGVLAERFSLEAIPPFIVLQAVALIILFELLARGNQHLATNNQA